MPHDKEHLVSYPTSIGIISGMQKLPVDGDVAVFKIEHDLLAEDADNPTSTDAAADSSSNEIFISNISSEETVLPIQRYLLPQFLPDSVQCLKLKTHFTEVIEELRMRRIADKENEDKVKQLVRDSQVLESKCEEAVAKARLAEQERDSKVVEVKKSLEDKLKDLLDQQGRHVLALEVSEKESKLLKDEIRTLQLCKYSLEKQIRELECKLQLQSSSLDSSLTQFSQLESVCRTVRADLGQLTEQTNRLDSSVKEATKLNQQLNHTIHHQKLAATDQTNKISQLQKDLAVARASYARSLTENQLRVTENEQLLKATQQDLKTSRDDVERLRRQLQDKQHELNKTLELVNESHCVIGRHRDTIEFLEQQSRTLEESVTETTVKCSSLERRLNDALKQTSELRQVNNSLRTEHADQADAHKSQLKTVEERCAELVQIQSDLETLNSVWSQRNVQLTERIDALNLKMNKAVTDASAETDVCDCASKGVQASRDCTDQLTQVVITLANNGTQTAAEQKLPQSTQTAIVDTRSITVDATAPSFEAGTQTVGNEEIDGNAGSVLNLGNNMSVGTESVPESLPATPDDIDLQQTAVIADCPERDRQVATAIFVSQTAVGSFQCGDKFSGNEARAPVESMATFLASRPLADLSSSVNSTVDVSYIGNTSNDETSETNSPMPPVSDEESRIDISVKILAISANGSVEFGGNMNLQETLPTAELHLSTVARSVTTAPCIVTTQVIAPCNVSVTTASRSIIKPSSFRPPFVSQKDDTLVKEMHVSSWKRDEVDSLPNHGTVAEMENNLMYGSDAANLDVRKQREKSSFKVTCLLSEGSCVSKPATELMSTTHVLESQHYSVAGSGTRPAEVECQNMSQASVAGVSLNQVVVAGTLQMHSILSSASSASVELEPGKDNRPPAACETQLVENSDASIACETFALKSSRLPETGNESATQNVKNDKNQNYVVGFSINQNSNAESGEARYGSVQKGSVSSLPDHGLLSSDALEHSNSHSTRNTGIILPSSFMFSLRQPLFAPDTMPMAASNAEMNSSDKLQQQHTTASISLSVAASQSAVTNSDTSVAQSRMNFSTCTVTSVQTTTALPCFAPSLQTRNLPTGMLVGTIRSKLLRPSAMQQHTIHSPGKTAQNYTGYQEPSHAVCGNGQILGADLLQLSTTAVCNTSVPTNISTTAGSFDSLSAPANLRKPFSLGRVQSTGVNLGRAPSDRGVNKQTASLNQSGHAASAGSPPLPCTGSRCAAAPTENLSPLHLASDEAPTDRTTADGVAAKGRSKRHLFSSKGQLMDCSSEAQTPSPNVSLSTVWPPASTGRGLDRTHRKLPSILHHDADASPLPKKAKKVTFMKPPLQLTSDPAVPHVTDADSQVKVHATSEQPEST